MRRWLNLPLFCFALAAPGIAETSPSKIAITHIGIVAVSTGTIKPDMTVLIEGNRITAVRRSKNKESLPKEIQVVDGQGKFLLPGLWDMHVHTDGDDRVLHLLLANGITGIRDMGGEFSKLADARRRIDSGELMAPRIIFAGPMLKGPSEEGDDWAWIISKERTRTGQRGASATPPDLQQKFSPPESVES